MKGRKAADYCIPGEIVRLALWSRIDEFIRTSCIGEVNFIFQETAISYRKGTSS